MTSPRHLIVNADDFGQSRGINAGIAECFENGIVTSTSLMVRWPAAVEASEYARANPELSVGLHLDLGEWKQAGGEWQPVYEVASLENPGEVENEARHQLNAFMSLLGRKPTHLDSHQHTHLREPVKSVLLNMAKDLEIPLRHCSDGVRYCGDFYGQESDGQSVPEAISPEGLINLLASLESPVTELACHPGKDIGLDTMYRTERQQEMKTLTDPRVLEALGRFQIRLCSFDSLP